MKKFLLNIAVFGCLLAACFVIPATIYAMRIRLMSFELPGAPSVLFISASDVETSINDELIPSTKNFSTSSNHYVNMFFEIERILDDNPQIKTVFVGVSPHTLSAYGDDRMFGNYTMQGVLPKMFPFYTWSEWKMFLSWNKANTPLRTIRNLLCSKPMLYVGILCSRKSILDRLGKRLDSEGKNLEESLKKGADTSERIYLGCEIQCTYLRKIVESVRMRGARVVFYCAPFYDSDKFMDKEFFRDMLEKKFADVEFWDYIDYPLPDDCRQDFAHVNRWGAEILAPVLTERMRREGILPPQNSIK